MNNIEILANIFSKSVLLKNYMLILNGSEVKAYKDNGRWYIEEDVDGLAIKIGLNEIKDISWGKNSIKFTWGEDNYKLQIVQSLDLNQFRFAK